MLASQFCAEITWQNSWRLVMGSKTSKIIPLTYTRVISQSRELAHALAA